MNQATELISPQQSDTLVILAAVLVTLIGGGWAWRRHNARVSVLMMVAGFSLWPLWKLHLWLTRFDPVSGYFGLESVKVLLLEAALFVAIGALFGWSWRKLTAPDAAPESRRK